jgi:hypothetical protein
MTDFTDYTEEQVISWMFEDVQMDTPPTDLYLALHDGSASETGDQNEISFSGYSRVTVSNPSAWNISGNTASNANDITFGEAGEDWKGLEDVSLWTTADNTGNAIAAFTMDNSPFDVAAGTELRFLSGDLQFQID